MRRTIGTDAVQLLRASPRRIAFEIEFLPSSIVAGNTGLVFVAYGHAMGASGDPITSDEELNAGSVVTASLEDGDSPQRVTGEVWARADAASQIIKVKEDVSLG